MKRTLRMAVMMIAMAGMLSAAAAVAVAGARIKDIAKIQGARENQLVGYGLVVGLNGSGDGVNLTKQSMQNLLQKLGIQVETGDINADNMAAVMVTANIPAFAKPGDVMDVVVSSVGDADSLQGGTLVRTALRGADGEVYLVAQGPVSIGGYNTSGGAAAMNLKGFPTVGRIPGGGIVEKEIPADIVDGKTLYINLNNPDFTTANHTERGINARFGAGTAKALDAATIRVVMPEASVSNAVGFIADMESIQVQQDEKARVVVNERTGTIVMGGDITISPVAIAHGSLTVTVRTSYEASQPLPFSGGQTVVIPQTTATAKENKVTFTRVSTGDIVKALNGMGVTPSDIIAIFQALKASGAMQAELVIM